METKKVYSAICAVASEMAERGISKDRANRQQNFMFRGIDQVYNALAPVLVKYGLVILPRIVERTVTERTTQKGTVLFYVVVKAEFDFVSTEDSSIHTVTTYGEAMDSGDKATNKAMSIAYKYAAFQTFCIPTEETTIDADAETHSIKFADADQILSEFTKYASTEVDPAKLQDHYKQTWTRLGGFSEHQSKCKNVTGIRLKELKQAA